MKKISSLTWVYIAIILAPGVLFLPFVLNGETLYWGTPSLQFIPWWNAAWESMLDGILPLWNPNNGMGAPLLANYQSAIFYPPNWFLFLIYCFGGVGWMSWAVSLLVFGHLAFGGLGFAKLVNRIGLSSLAQAICGISFSLCGYFIARSGFVSMIYVGVWFPWLLYFASGLGIPIRGVVNIKSNTDFGIIFTLSMMLFAGHAQSTWYILIYAASWVVVGSYLRGGFIDVIRKVAHFMLLGVGSCLIAAVQLLPTMEYFLQSQRSSSIPYENAMMYSFWPWRMATLIAPNFFGNPGNGDFWGYASYWEDAIYIGVLPLIMALATVITTANAKKPRYHKYFALIVFLVAFCSLSILFALGKNTPVFIFLYKHIPTFNLFQAPARYLIWLELSLILLAGIGVDYWKRPSGRALYWCRLFTAGGGAVTLGAVVAWKILSNIELTFIKATAISGVWFLLIGILTLIKPEVGEQKTRQDSIWKGLVVLLLLTDLWSANWTTNPGINKKFFDQPTSSLNKIGSGRIYVSRANEYQIKFRRFFRFNNYFPLEDRFNLRLTFLPNLNLLDGISSANNFDPLVPGRFAIWMDELQNAPESLKNIWLNKMNVVYEISGKPDLNEGVDFITIEGGNRTAWSYCPIFVDDDHAALQTLRNSITSSDQMVVELKRTATPCHFPQTTPEMQISLDERNHIRLSIISPEDGWLELRDTWFPGWTATIDGTQTIIHHADYLFRAINVPKGNHIVEFVYQPISFFTGLSVSIVSILVMLLFWKKRSIRKH